MSASAFSPTSRSSWRSHVLGAGGVGFQVFDPSQSYPYTVSMGGFSALDASTFSIQQPPPQNGTLSQSLVERGLSDLGRTRDGTGVAFLSLTLKEQGLRDISLVSSFPHLHTLDLSSNNLTELSVLSSLSYLTRLNVSHNKLTSVLDFSPPKNLLEADYSNNEIEEIGDLSLHHSLETLTLDGNQITEISGLGSLQRLSHLSLASNRIETISNLDRLPLKILKLSGNNIKKIENLETLTDLMATDLSGNQISRLGGLGGHYSLMELYLQDNIVVEREELLHLKDLKNLRTLSLAQNPLDTVPEYRSFTVFHLPFLTRLDDHPVTIEEKVSAVNRFNPPVEVQAAHDHRTNTKLAVVNKPATLRFSTLTRLDEPYPMLILCGPPGSGQETFVKLLVEEFPSFFGLGVSHTTQAQGGRQGHGLDYYFIDDGTFNRALKSGEFIETHEVGGNKYGLTMAAVEQVAHQGLACVTHMALQGVLTMKNTHFEPRYILTLPLTPQIHAQRLQSMGQYNEEQIRGAVRDVTVYQQIHLNRPGFFDAAINTDSIRDGYKQLRALVMAYGDISPESPLSMSQVTSTTFTSSTSHQTTPTPDMVTPTLIAPLQESTVLQTSQNESIAVDSSEGEKTGRGGGEGGEESKASRHQPQPSSSPSPYPTPEVAAKIKGMAQTWSRPASSVGGGGSSRPTSGNDVRQRPGSRTPLSEFGERHQRLVEEAVTGNSRQSYFEKSYRTPPSRPCTSTSKSGPDDIQAALREETEEEEEDDEEFSSSEEDEGLTDTQSSLSKLSSARGFSPTPAD